MGFSTVGYAVRLVSGRLQVFFLNADEFAQTVQIAASGILSEEHRISVLQHDVFRFVLAK